MPTFLNKLFFSFLICFTAVALATDLSVPATKYFPSYKQHGRVSARNIINPGIGYDHGYTTVESFLAPNPTNRTFLPFIDLRGHVFNDGLMAANAGIGFRKSKNCTAYGLNLYYDYRQTPKMHYNQMGVGAEILGQKYDLRINGYIPIKRKITAPYNSEFAGFTGHNMLVSQNYLFAMKGWNAELGLHAGKVKFLEFYAAAGTYYFTESAGPNFWGGKLRLTCKFQDYFTIELSNSYDHYFRNRFQCQFTFNLPFGGDEQINTNNKCDEPRLIASRMVQPVERQEIIVQGHKKQNNVAIDPTTNEPFYFVFVDNTSNSLGTYESPYPTLNLAEVNSKAGDIIYIFPGDGTTTGMDSGIVLKANQKLWGSGTPHALQTTQGAVAIPALTSTMPSITNLTGSAITLDGINDISGLKIANCYDHAIFGPAAKNISISDCTVDNSGDPTYPIDQINLIYSDTTGQAILDRLTVTNSSLNGIFIDSSATDMSVTINNSTFEHGEVYGINGNFANQASVTIKNNLLTNSANGIALNFNGPATALISGNEFNAINSISEKPIEIITAAGPITATIENNNIHDNTCGGILLSLNNTSDAQINIENNIITNNDHGAFDHLGSAIVIYPQSTTIDNCHLVLANNTITDNTGDALYSTDGSFNTLTFEATNNTITNNGGGGLLFNNACDVFNFTAKNNVISEGNDNAILTAGGVLIDTMNVICDNNQITNNAHYANGIAFSHNGTNLNMTITNNEISNNEGTAIFSYSGSEITNISANIDNNMIQNNQNSNVNATGGIGLEQFINFTGAITNNTMSGNDISTPDLYIGSTQTTPPVACLELSGNSSENGYSIANPNAGGTFNLTPCDVSTINTGAIQTSGTIDIVKSCANTELCPP